MIPKIIHYCWFGGNPLPALAQKCISSWKKYLPDYEIREWNERNFDIESNIYVKEAYGARKFAFVTDYVRLFALYNEGGIYMDTDVEVLKSLDRFLIHSAFLGFEDDRMISTGIMASEKGARWAKDNLAYYSDRHFLRPDGTFDLTTNVIILTEYMLKQGLQQNNTYQDFPDLITFYPKDFFSPKSHKNGKLYLTENTYTIHHFAGSWLTPWQKSKRKIINYLGVSLTSRIVKTKKLIKRILG